MCQNNVLEYEQEKCLAGYKRSIGTRTVADSNVVIQSGTLLAFVLESGLHVKFPP